ncbi:hypothetical protein D3C73_1287380 [compost metagenome]
MGGGAFEIMSPFAFFIGVPARISEDQLPLPVPFQIQRVRMAMCAPHRCSIEEEIMVRILNHIIAGLRKSLAACPDLRSFLQFGIPPVFPGTEQPQNLRTDRPLGDQLLLLQNGSEKGYPLSSVADPVRVANRCRTVIRADHGE